MSKDPFQQLVDEITLIRGEVQALKRSSLDRDEAKALSETLARAVDRMERAARQAPRALVDAFAQDRAEIARETAETTSVAAVGVLKNIRDQLTQDRLTFSQAAGEARRAAWRYFGGFWVWLVAMLATGAVLGVLAAYGTETAKSYFSVGDMARYSCERSWVRGVRGESEGQGYCVLWDE